MNLCAPCRVPALSLLGVGADRPKWCPAESKMFRHADKALAGSFHGIRVVPARIVSPGAVQVGASSLRSLRRISSHSMRRSLQNGSYSSYYLLGPTLVPAVPFFPTYAMLPEVEASLISQGQLVVAVWYIMGNCLWCKHCFSLHLILEAALWAGYRCFTQYCAVWYLA